MRAFGAGGRGRHGEGGGVERGGGLHLYILDPYKMSAYRSTMPESSCVVNDNRTFQAWQARILHG